MKKIMSCILLFIFILTTIIMPNVHATSVFDSVLTDGKLVVNSIPPKTEEEAYSIFSDIGLEGFYVNVSSCTNNYTSCTLNYSNGSSIFEEKTVTIEYKYDKSIKTAVDSIVENIPDKEYKMSDAEFINYALYGTDETVYNYSEDIKKDIGYKNFYFEVGAGGGGLDLTSQFIADLKFAYNNSIYYVKPMVILTLDRIVYVPTDTADSDILNVVEKRFNSTSATITEEGSINDYYNTFFGEEYETRKGWDPSLSGVTKADFITDQITNINNNHPELDFLNNAVDKYYKVEVNGVSQVFVVIKDSTKIKNITYKTSDVGSDISIESTSNKVPLDTIIKVSKLTSGTEYERIMNILKVSTSETFDLSLYSKGTNSYITTLDDGTFKVRIPINSELAGKNLIVYYVDTNGEVKDYSVTPSVDGYAEFITDHFSTYTLAAVDTLTGTTPETGDSIVVYIVLFVVCLSVIIGLTIYSKNKNNK